MPPGPPYQPPQGPLGYGFYQQPVNPIGPARRASVMMWVLAALLLLCGVGFIAIVSTVDLNPLVEQSERIYGPEMAAQMKAAGMNADQMRLSGYFWGAVGLVAGVLMGVLGLLVFRGRMWAIISSIVLVSLLTLLNLCSAGLSLLVMARAGPKGLVGGCVMLVPLAVCCVLLYFLAQAAKAVTASTRMQQYMQLQYWQSMHQSAGMPPGYGYWTPPPPGQPVTPPASNPAPPNDNPPPSQA